MRLRSLVFVGANVVALSFYACAKEYGDASPFDSGIADARVEASGEGSSSTRELCGDGIDQDGDGKDPPCPPNDSPGGAVDVTNGGTFGNDLTFAHPSPDPWACGDKEGRALFYTVTLSSLRVYYFDTFGSDFDTVVRVFPGIACANTATTVTAPICADDACSGTQSQAAARLPPGQSCIVVAQKSATETKGAVSLHVVPGLDAIVLPPAVNGVSTVTGDTCTSSSTVTTDCGTAFAQSKALTYFFTTCGATDVAANTCGSTLDTVLFMPSTTGDVSATCNLNGAPGTNCGAGDSKLTMNIPSPGIGFIGVTSALGPDCGAFTMTVTSASD